MRKHFLLFLLALLPFAGWADEIGIEPANYPVEYGKDIPTKAIVDMIYFRDDLPDGVNQQDVADALEFNVVKPSTEEVWSVGDYEYEFTLKPDYNKSGNLEGHTIKITGKNGLLKITKAKATITTAPVANTATLTYACGENLLVADDAEFEGGTLAYLLTAKNSSSTDEDWSETIPAADEELLAAEYDLHVKVVGDANHYDSDETVIAVTVNLATPTLTGTLVLEDEYTYAPGLNIQPSGYTTDFEPAAEYVAYYYAKWDGSKWSATTRIRPTTEFEAGTYRIRPGIAAQEGKWKSVTPSSTWKTVVVNKANALSTPVAAADVTYNSEAQELVTGPAAGIVQYQLDGGKWSTDIPTGKDAKAYTVKYKVDNPNYETVGETELTGVEIKPALLAVKVNDATKVYDGKNDNLNDADILTVDGGKAKFTFLNETFESDADDLLAVSYADLDDEDGIKATKHKDILTVTKDALETVSKNYDYTIIPATLTIEKKEIYVEAKEGIETEYGTPKDISNEYTVEGLVGSETAEDAFTTVPVLTAPTALPAENPEVGEYDLEFTEGVINADGNYVLRATEPYVIGSNKFTVKAVGGSKVVITVVPKTVTYTGEADDFEMVLGTDYYVSGLVGDDTAETVFKAGTLKFTRENSDTKFDCGIYKLEASAELAHPERYATAEPVCIQGTLTIEPRELVATIKTQYVVKDATEFDEEAFEIEWYGDEDLGATLTMSSTANPGTFEDGLTLTITNKNFTLADGLMTQNGTLVVLSSTDLVLNGDNALATIPVADGNTYNVKVGRTLNGGKWNVLVLPFEVSTWKFCQAIEQYAAFNTLTSIDGLEETDVHFSLEMNTLPANTPFLVKPNEDVDLSAKTFNSVTIEDKEPIQSFTGYGQFIGTYADAIDLPEDSYALQGGGFKHFTAAKENAIKFTRAYIKLTSAAPARFFVEELDGNGATAIKQLNADTMETIDAEGWYTINGMKLDAAPTTKGIYINNGKKVVIK